MPQPTRSHPWRVRARPNSLTSVYSRTTAVLLAQQPQPNLYVVFARRLVFGQECYAFEAVQWVDLARELGSKRHAVDDVTHVVHAGQHVTRDELQAAQ